MSVEPQRVFLSYTAEDLHEHARVVAAELRKRGHEPVDHTDWAASGRPSVQECRDHVSSCTMLVVLVAHRYGWVPTRSASGDDERSITWLEVEHARGRGLPVLPFVLHSKASWPMEHVEGLSNPTALDGLRRFKSQLQSGVCGFFLTEEQLALDVTRAVDEAASRMTRSAQRAPADAVVGEYTDYRRRLEHKLRRVKFIGFGEQFQVSLAISELWVPLRASVPRSFVAVEAVTSAKQLDHAEHVQASKVEDAFRCARKYDLRAIVMLGDPGSGKTTAARRIAWQCADLVQGPESLGLPADVIPVLLRLRDLRNDEVELEPLLGRTLDQLVAADPTLADRLLKRHRIVWILDGLDEVASLSARARVSAWIRQVHERHIDDWFLVTSRKAGYEKEVELGADFLVMSVSPLDDDQRRDFVARWYSTVERQVRGDDPDAHALASERSADLLAILGNQDWSRSLASMAANPLLLTILCIVHRCDQNLPQRRVELYGKCVNVLLDSWRHELRKLQGKSRIDTAVARLVLQPLAWHLHQQDKRTEADLDELVELAQPSLDRLGAAQDETGDARAFLRRIHDDSGLLVSAQPGRYAFLHQTFQEFLAARHAVDAALPEELARHFGEPWWNEPILLALGCAPNEAFASAFFDVVLGTSGWGRDDLRMLFERCIGESLFVPAVPFTRRLRDANTPPALARLLARLFKSSKDQALAELARSVEVRLRAAEVRAAVRLESPTGSESSSRLAGASAMSASTRDSNSGLEFVEIPAGKFDMGGNVHRDERPVHPVKIERFWLAVHPVTNAQYERFLRAAEHRAPDYWTNSSFNGPSQPVVGVSWEDAQVYCKWAGCVLPTEAQWEYACRAGTKTEYWSGDSTHDMRQVGWCFENAGGKLHAVAERSASPFGLYDMHGNVWEWCQDTYHDSYKDAPADGRARVDKAPELRVTRGGSFMSTAEFARSAFRERRLASSQGGSLGFRPARSSLGPSRMLREARQPR